MLPILIVLLLRVLQATGTLHLPSSASPDPPIGNCTRLADGSVELFTLPEKHQHGQWLDSTDSVICDTNYDYNRTLAHNCSKQSLHLKSWQDGITFSCESFIGNSSTSTDPKKLKFDEEKCKPATTADQQRGRFVLIASVVMFIPAVAWLIYQWNKGRKRIQGCPASLEA